MNKSLNPKRSLSPETNLETIHESAAVCDGFEGYTNAWPESDIQPHTEV